MEASVVPRQRLHEGDDTHGRRRCRLRRRQEQAFTRHEHSHSTGQLVHPSFPLPTGRAAAIHWHRSHLRDQRWLHQPSRQREPILPPPPHHHSNTTAPTTIFHPPNLPPTQPHSSPPDLHLAPHSRGRAAPPSPPPAQPHSSAQQPGIGPRVADAPQLAHGACPHRQLHSRVEPAAARLSPDRARTEQHAATSTAARRNLAAPDPRCTSTAARRAESPAPPPRPAGPHRCPAIPPSSTSKHRPAPRPLLSFKKGGPRRHRPPAGLCPAASSGSGVGGSGG